MNCPGSVTLSKGKPNNSSDAAQEGTAAHAVAEKCLLEELDPKSFVGQDIEGWVITDAMVPHISEYVDMVRGESAFASHVGIEERFTILKEYGIFGTADACLIQGDVLHVIDLKFGIGLSVDAYKNKQGMLYAWGAYDNLKASDKKRIKTVRITIYQPRKNNHSTWGLPIADLELFMHEVKEAAAKASSGSMECNIGDWCRWCKGKVECPAQYEAVNEMARKTFEPADPHYAEITDKELVKVFLIKDAVKKYLEAVDAYLYQKTTSGSKFEGLKLVMGRKGNQTWENKDESIEFLEAMVGEEVFKERDLKTPTQIKKLSPELEKDIEALTFRPEAKMKLVSQADKGKEISVDAGADAQAVFSSK
jgi:hypothetical protein